MLLHAPESVRILPDLMCGCDANPTSECPAGRSRCSVGWKQLREGSTGNIHGWRLVVNATGIFLLPLALAVAGAFWGGPSAARQLLGATVGFIVGLAPAVAVSTIMRSRRRRIDNPQPSQSFGQEEIS